MELAAQRRLAAKVMKCGESRIWMDPSRLGDISQAITTQDIRRLVGDGVITKQQKKGVSKARTQHIVKQKEKGRRKGAGSRKGAFGSRWSRKGVWIKAIRAQRSLAKQLLKEGKITKQMYKDVYRKSSGGYFRSRSHIMQYAGLEQPRSEKAKK